MSNRNPHGDSFRSSRMQKPQVFAAECWSAEFRPTRKYGQSNSALARRMVRRFRSASIAQPLAERDFSVARAIEVADLAQHPIAAPAIKFARGIVSSGRRSFRQHPPAARRAYANFRHFNKPPTDAAPLSLRRYNNPIEIERGIGHRHPAVARPSDDMVCMTRPLALDSAPRRHHAVLRKSIHRPLRFHPGERRRNHV